jgi:tRNA (guanine-N7-)-methyltransferase
MKKSDLKIPFDFENRKPVLIDRLLYVPNNYEDHLIFNEKLFLTERDIYLEYCSGNGDWILQEAKKNPNINFIAVEKKFLRARKIWVKMHNEKVNNLLVVLSDAQTFTKYYLKDNTISKIYINFPDPWPKKKHAKNRLIQNDFIPEMKRVLIGKKNIEIVTDDENYSNQIIQNMNIHFKSVYEDPFFEKNLEYGKSYFKELWISKGKDIRFHKFKKT